MEEKDLEGKTVYVIEHVLALRSCEDCSACNY